MWGNTWLFVVGYIGLVVGFLTALYLAIRYLVARRAHARDFDMALDTHSNEEVQLDARLQNMENLLEHLVAVNNRLSERLKWIEGQMGAALTNGGVAGRKTTTTEEQLVQAYEQGKTVGDLADEFGRGKGEIELMLNLRKIRQKGVGN